MSENKRSYHNCCVLSCLNTTVNSEATFFSLPIKTERRNEWLKLINREDLNEKASTHCRVCEHHFETSCILTSPNRKVLKKNSIPTLLLPKIADRKCGKKKTKIIIKTSDAYTQCNMPQGSNVDFNGKSHSNQPKGQNKNDELHEAFSCNICQGPIVKYRYTCLQCPDFDICALCEANGKHSQHFVLRIPGPRPYSEIQMLLVKLRVQLFSYMKEEERVTESDGEYDSRNKTDPVSRVLKIEEPEIRVKIEPSMISDPFMDQTMIDLDLIHVKTEPDEEADTTSRIQTCNISIAPIQPDREPSRNRRYSNSVEAATTERNKGEKDGWKRRKKIEKRKPNKENGSICLTSTTVANEIQKTDLECKQTDKNNS